MKVTTYKRGRKVPTDGGETSTVGGEMCSEWAKRPVSAWAKRPGGETFWWRNVQRAKRPGGETSWERNVQSSSSSSGGAPTGEHSRLHN